MVGLLIHRTARLDCIGVIGFASRPRRMERGDDEKRDRKSSWNFSKAVHVFSLQAVVFVCDPRFREDRRRAKFLSLTASEPCRPWAGPVFFRRTTVKKIIAFDSSSRLAPLRSRRSDTVQEAALWRDGRWICSLRTPSVTSSGRAIWTGPWRASSCRTKERSGGSGRI